MSKIIELLLSIIGGATVGIITYWVSSKLWPASMKKEGMVHVLDNALKPISKVIGLDKLISIDELISNIEQINGIMADNPFDIPPVHRYKINDLNKLIEKYEEQKDDTNRRILEKQIRNDYKSYIAMFHIQCNYIRKQLGIHIVTFMIFFAMRQDHLF